MSSKLSALPPIPAVNDTDLFYAVPAAGGAQYAAPATSILAYLTSKMALKLTYTGSPQYAMVMALSRNMAIATDDPVIGQQTYAPIDGPCIGTFAYQEAASTLTGKNLLTLSFDDLTGVSVAFAPTSLPLLTALQLNALVAAQTFTPNNMALLTTLEANVLRFVMGAFGPSSMAALTTLRFDALETVGLNFQASSMAALTTFSFAALRTVGGLININTMASLTAINLPALQYVGGIFQTSFMAACTSVALPAMINYGGSITLGSSMGSVASVTLGTIGTLKAIQGSQISLAGLNLPSSNVNAILALLVSLDGTNGTTLWGAGKTLTINGGTTGAPTGQGIIDKATLQSRGATINTN